MCRWVQSQVCPAQACGQAQSQVCPAQVCGQAQSQVCLRRCVDGRSRAGAAGRAQQGLLILGALLWVVSAWASELGKDGKNL